LENSAAGNLRSGFIAARCRMQWHQCHQECLARLVPVARVAPGRPATGACGRNAASSRVSQPTR